MAYPLVQHELTVHMHNSNRYLRLGEGLLVKLKIYNNLYGTGFHK